MTIFSFPKYCGHLRIFVSYSRADAEIAKPIAERLKLNNATVFFDQECIDEINFDGQIRREIDRCDVFVVLLSRDFVDNPSSFTHAEYLIAREIFENRPDRIVPVIVDPDLEISNLDEYLRARQIITGPGDLSVRVSALIDNLRPIKLICWLLAALAAVIVMLWVAWLILPPLPPVSLLVPDMVELRPVEEPPIELGEEVMQHRDWLDGDPIFYSFNLELQHLSDRGPTVRLLNATADFKVFNRAAHFDWLYLGCVANGCEGAENWLGQKGPPTGETTTIQPGKLFSEEVIYRSEPYRAVSYQELLDLLLKSNFAMLEIGITARVAYSIAFVPIEQDLHVTCQVDMADWRTGVQAWMEEKNRYPFWSQLNCKNTN